MPTYRTGPARIIVADSIADPISSWTYLGHTRGGTITHDVALALGRVDQFSAAPIADSVFQAPSPHIARFRLADSEAAKMLESFPGSVRTASSTKESLTFAHKPASYSSKAVMIVPELEYDDALVPDSANVTYFQEATLRIEEVPVGTDVSDSDDAIVGFDLVVESLSGKVGRGYPAIGSPELYPQGVQFAWQPIYDGLVPMVRDSYTFSRASTGTYVDANGVIQTAAINVPRYDGATGRPIVEPQSSNKYPNSATLSSHSASSATRSVISEVTTPDGSTGAVKLAEDATASTTHQLLYDMASVFGVGQAVACSVYAKAGSSSRYHGFVVETSDGAGASKKYEGITFDASSGTVANTYAETSQIRLNPVESLANGWYRISFVIDPGASRKFDDSRLYILNSIPSGSSYVTYSGDGSSHIYWWGLQFEASDRLTSYIPTSGSTVTRSADVWGGAATFTRASSATYVRGGTVRYAGTNEARIQDSGLLLEPQRTNVAQYSGLNNDSDTSSGSGSSLSTSTKMTFSEIGITGRRNVQGDNNSFFTNGWGATETPSTSQVSLGSPITISFWYRRNSGTVALKASCSLYIDGVRTYLNTDGSWATSGETEYSLTAAFSLADYDDGQWHRLSFTSDPIPSGTAITSPLTHSGPYRQSANWSYDIAGLQIEVGSYPTSYIPTAGASVTRSRDRADAPFTKALVAAGLSTYFKGTPVSHTPGWQNLFYVGTGSAGAGEYRLYGVSYSGGAFRFSLNDQLGGSIAVNGSAQSWLPDVESDILYQFDETNYAIQTDAETGALTPHGLDINAGDVPESGLVRLDCTFAPSWEVSNIVLASGLLTPAQIRKFLR